MDMKYISPLMADMHYEKQLREVREMLKMTITDVSKKCGYNEWLIFAVENEEILPNRHCQSGKLIIRQMSYYTNNLNCLNWKIRGK